MKAGHWKKVLLASAMLAANPVPAGSTTHDPKSDQDWRTVVIHQTPAGDIGARYRKMHAAYWDMPDTAQGRAAYAAQYQRFQAGPEFLFEGEYDPQNMWRFIAPAAGDWPTQALQLKEDSTEAGYHFTVHVWCESDADCAAARDLAQAWPSPPPNGDAGDKARSQWQSMVLNEPCKPGPVHMPAPRYPPGAVRQGIGGTVRLTILANPCGDVRNVWISTSSGNRDIDLAALAGARKWRIALPAELAAKRQGGMFGVPIGFAPP